MKRGCRRRFKTLKGDEIRRGFVGKRVKQLEHDTVRWGKEREVASEEGCNRWRETRISDETADGTRKCRSKNEEGNRVS